MKKSILLGGVVFVFFAYFASFVGSINAGDATLTLDDNAGSSSFVVQDVDKTNQFKVNSDGQGYFAGNVGIGTTNPAEDLHVAASSGQANIAADALSTSVGASFRLLRAGTLKGYFYLNNAADDNVYFGTSSKDPAVTFAANGNVGIGTTAPTEKLEVSGNIKASGTVSQGSSKEFKKNISYVSTKDAMKALNKLNPVRFEYKTDDSGEKHLGFIAEDVPDLVAEQDHKHLNSMDITAVLTKVVQEQQRQIQEQKAMITTLMEKVKTLEKRI